MKSFVAAAVVAMTLIPMAANAMSHEERQTRIAAAVARTEVLEADYKVCVVDNTVRLGRSNSEPSDNVVRAAFSKCQDIEQSYRGQFTIMAVLNREVGQGTFLAQANHYMAKLQQDSTSDAMAALLDARAGQ